MEDVKIFSEISFPDGGFINVLDDGFIHIKGCPRFYPPDIFKISVSDDASVKLYVDGDESDDEGWASALYSKLIVALYQFL